MKVYISGAISNRDPEEVRKEFERVEKLLSSLGLEAVNPLANGLTDAHTWREHMRADLHLLLECDKIVVLPGWRESKGARLEVFVATELGMEVMQLVGGEFMTARDESI